MATQPNQTQAPATQRNVTRMNNNAQPPRHTIGSTFSQLLGATSSIIAAVDNTAKIAEHTTGTLADKAQNWRETSAIADAITHNQLLAELRAQAEELGIETF